MDMDTCVVTGGGGFIGCALSASLANRFDFVVVIDKLHPQIHQTLDRPSGLHETVEFRQADITEAAVWDRLLEAIRPQVIIHLAAETGTGQSLTEASRHARENVLGTTVMLDAFVRHNHVPDRFVLASSRAVYGEGAWCRAEGAIFYPGPRDHKQLAQAQWDFAGAEYLPCSANITRPLPTSVYGATKLAQEYILSSWASAFGAKLDILRLQNVYGPGQSLINSYTGIVSLFARLARERKSIPLYEDGVMLRDFVYIDDVASAVLAVLSHNCEVGYCLDVGAGRSVTIRAVGEFMARRYGAPSPHVTGMYRHGDVRHASCDISATVRELNWRPQWTLESGLEALCGWIDRELTPTVRTASSTNIS